MSYRHLGGVLVVTMLAAISCGSAPDTAAQVTPTTPVPTYLTPTIKPGLTPHEKIACGKWAKMVEYKTETQNLGTMWLYVRYDIAREAGVDAEGQAVHKAAVVLADLILDANDPGETMDDTATQAAMWQLEAACGR